MTDKTKGSEPAASDFPMLTRMRWYADLNSYKAPADFPLPLPDMRGDFRAAHADATFTAAWHWLTDDMPNEMASLGWWRYALGRSDTEWRQWWGERKQCDQAAADALLAALEATP